MTIFLLVVYLIGVGVALKTLELEFQHSTRSNWVVAPVAIFLAATWPVELLLLGVLFGVLGLVDLVDR